MLHIYGASYDVWCFFFNPCFVPAEVSPKHVRILQGKLVNEKIGQKLVFIRMKTFIIVWGYREGSGYMRVSIHG